MKRLFKLIFLFILLGFTVGCVSNIDSLGLTKLFDKDESSLAKDYKKDLVINDYDDYSNSGDYVHTLHLLCGYNKKDHTWVDAEEKYVNLNLTICNNSDDSFDSYDKFISFSNSLIENKDYIIFECSGYGYINNDYIYPTKICYYDNKLYVLDDNYNTIFVINNYNFEKGSYYYYFNISDSVEFVSNNNENNDDGNTYLHTITITNTEHAYLSNNSTDKQQDYYLNEYSFTFSFNSNSDIQINTNSALSSYFISCNGGDTYTLSGSGTKTPHCYYFVDNNGEWNDIPTSLNKLCYSNNIFKYGFDSNSWFIVKFLNTTQVDSYYGIEYDFIITDYTFNIIDTVSLAD